MPDLRASENELAKVLTRLERVTSFADLMAGSTQGQGLRLDRRSTSPGTRPYFRGAILRAWGGTRWVEASTTDLSTAGLGGAAEAVEHLLAATPSRSPLPVLPPPFAPRSSRTRRARSPASAWRA